MTRPEVNKVIRQFCLMSERGVFETLGFEVGSDVIWPFGDKRSGKVGDQRHLKNRLSQNSNVASRIATDEDR